MVIPMVVDVVLKLGCHGSTGNYLYQSVVDDFEVHICKDQEHSNEDLAVEIVKMYVLN